VAALVSEHGLRVAEVEGLFGWAALPEQAEESRSEEATVFAMADVFGADHMITVGPPPGTYGRAAWDELAERFAGLCDRAADHGLRVALEFVPQLTELEDLASALEIVERADRPNGGICLDAWHFFRGAQQFDVLQTVPLDRLVLLQLCDGPTVPLEPDYERDTLTNRQIPGVGEFDLARMMAALDRGPSDTYISVEVFSTALQELPFADAARLLAAGGRDTLAGLRRR
jgi:sugar phosphate isomerase/epimerase